MSRLVILLVLAFSVSSTFGANWFVSEAGNSANNCDSPQTACAALSNLVSKGLASNDVIILSGVIRSSPQGQSDQLNVSVSPWNLGLTFQSAAGQTATMLTGSYFMTGSSGPVSRTFNNIIFNGATSTAFRISGGTWRFNDCTFTNNTAVNGGAMIIQDNAAVDLNNCIFGTLERGPNKAESNGGSLYVVNANVTLSNCRSNGYNNRTAFRGGFIAAGYGAKVRIQGGEHRSHYVDDRGGVISIDPLGSLADAANISITNVTFDSNTALAYGGAVYLDLEFQYQGGILSLRDSTCRRNRAELAHGGCLAIFPPASDTVAWNVTISDSRFQNNFAGDSGGDFITNSPTDIFRSNFSSSVAKSGGNLFLGYNIPLARLFGPILFSNSHATENGGCLATSAAIETYGELSFSNCSSGLNGGAIYSAMGLSTFYGGVTIDRSASANGGSVALKGAAATFSGRTILRNGTATTGHGGNLACMCCDAVFNGKTDIVGGRSLLGNGGNIALTTSDEAQIFGGVRLLGDVLVDGGRAESGYGANIYHTSDPSATYRPLLRLQGSSSAVPVRVTNGFASQGGNIYIDQGQSVEIDMTMLADSTGPHVWVSSAATDAVVAIYSSTLTRARNTTNGGGARVEAGQFNTENSNYTNHAVSGQGGALWIQGANAALISTCNFYNNSASDGGALFFTVFDPVVDFTHSGNNYGRAGDKDSANRASGRGGAVYAVGKFSTDQDNFFYNRATYGGAIHLFSDIASAPMFSKTTFHNNTASMDGGAIHITEDICLLADSWLNNNTAGRNGGAVAFICNNGGGPCGFLHASTNYTKNAAATGGAIYLSQSGATGADLLLPATNFEYNSAAVAGGAIAVISNSTQTNTYTILDARLKINYSPKGASLYLQGGSANAKFNVPRTGVSYYYYEDSVNHPYPIHLVKGYMQITENVVHAIHVDGAESRLEVKFAANISRVLLSNSATFKIIDYRILQVIPGGHIITGTNCSIIADVEGEIQLLQGAYLNATSNLNADKMLFSNYGGFINLNLNAPAVGNGVEPANECLKAPAAAEVSITIRNNFGRLQVGRQCVLQADIFQGSGEDPEAAEFVLPPVGTTFISSSFLSSSNSVVYATIYNATEVSKIQIDSGSVELNGAVVVRSFGSYAPMVSANYTFLTAWDVMSTSFNSITYEGRIAPGTLLDFSSSQTADTTTLNFGVTILPAPIAPPANPPVNPPMAPPMEAPQTPPVAAPVEPQPVEPQPVESKAPSRGVLPPNASPTAQQRSNNGANNGDGSTLAGGSSVGGIVGGIIGAILLLAIIAGLVAWFVLRKKRRESSGGAAVWDKHNDDQEMAAL